MAAAAASVDPFLLDAAIFLGAAVVAVPLFKRLGLGSVLGYLAAGSLLGPFALGIVDDPEEVLHFAELGVVLLLFVIGLELNPSRLWRLRAQILGLGLTQVLLAGTVIGIALRFVAGFDWPAAAAGGGALALSSTAFAVQIMRDKTELTTPYGDRAFSILLLQDIAIVPLLALTAFLSPRAAAGGFDWTTVAVAVASLALVFAIGRYGLRPLFQAIAIARADEVFTAAALLVVLGAALAMQFAGLSMAMGAFLAGVLLAESEFRHQLETDIEPFRGLLLGLFFIAVGMSLAWPLLIENWWIVLGGAVVLYLVKAAMIFAITRWTGSPAGDAVRIAAVLGQGGEFGFVLLTVGRTSGLWERQTETLLTAVITITMVMTPFVVGLADRWVARPRADELDGVEPVEAAQGGQIIIAGFGRFGQVIARILRLRGYELTLIDNDPKRIQIARTFGNTVFFGDLKRGDILRTAGAERARAIFLCGDDPEATARGVEILRERLPNTLIFARAADRFEELRLEALGADAVIRELFESAVALAQEGLERLGEGDRADDIIEEFRRRDQELLRLQSEYGAEGAYERMRARFTLEEEW